jgi:hypothetical protein
MQRDEKIIVARWEKAAQMLVGRKIVAVHYMTDKEMEATGFERRALVLQLDNGTLAYPSQDDEGNGPGALFTTAEECPCLPVI